MKITYPFEFFCVWSFFEDLLNVSATVSGQLYKKTHVRKAGFLKFHTLVSPSEHLEAVIGRILQT